MLAPNFPAPHLFISTRFRPPLSHPPEANRTNFSALPVGKSHSPTTRAKPIESPSHTATSHILQSAGVIALMLDQLNMLAVADVDSAASDNIDMFTWLRKAPPPVAPSDTEDKKGWPPRCSLSSANIFRCATTSAGPLERIHFVRKA